MISLVVPTYNRSDALRLSIPTFYCQKYLREIIFVDDCSTDNSYDIIHSFAAKYRHVSVKCIRNNIRQGVVFSRIIGYRQSKSEFVLFCDDDVLLESNYTEVCLNLIKANTAIGIVTGQLILQVDNNSFEESLYIFKNNFKVKEYFNFSSFCFRIDVKIDDEQIVPLSHSIMLTKKEYLLNIGFDTYYSGGTSYREESDFQASLLAKGLKTVITNKTHCLHLNKRTFNAGGNRMGKFASTYWAIKYSVYFINKHFLTYRKFYPDKISNSKNFLVLKLILTQISINLVKPLIHNIIPKCLN